MGSESEVLGDKPFWYVLVRVHRSGDPLTRKDASRLIRHFREEGTLTVVKVIGGDILALGRVAKMRYEDAKAFMNEGLDAALPIGTNTYVLEQWICSYGKPLPAALFDDY